MTRTLSTPTAVECAESVARYAEALTTLALHASDHDAEVRCDGKVARWTSVTRMSKREPAGPLYGLAIAVARL